MVIANKAKKTPGIKWSLEWKWLCSHAAILIPLYYRLIYFDVRISSSMKGSTTHKVSIKPCDWSKMIYLWVDIPVGKALLLAEQYESISCVLNVHRSNEVFIQYSATDNSSHSTPSMRRLTIIRDGVATFTFVYYAWMLRVVEEPSTLNNLNIFIEFVPSEVRVHSFAIKQLAVFQCLCQMFPICSWNLNVLWRERFHKT